MKYVKLNKSLKREPYYTDKPVLVLKKIHFNQSLYYSVELLWAGFNLNVNVNNTFEDEECFNLLREKKIERLFI